MIILHFSYRAMSSDELNCTDLDRILNSLSNEIGLDRKHDQARPQIQPFLKKTHFSTKIYGFFEFFFAQNDQRRQLHRNKASKIILKVYFRI